MHTPPASNISQQAPFVQTLNPGGQTLPQPPQFLRSLRVSTQRVPALQQVSPAPQPVERQLPAWQTPPTQVAPGPQASPQKPQLLGSLRVSTSQPSKTWLLQSAKPGVQLVIRHEELTHEVVPWGTRPHTFPQKPQLPLSLWVLAQKVTQHCCAPGQPAGPQGPTQVPPEQTSLGGHTLPQAPQLAGSALVLVSQPSGVNPLQLEKPGKHPRMEQALCKQAGSALG
jgi:hypothetical protein